MTDEDIAALKAQGEAEGWTFTVSANPATQYSLDELCGLVPPPDWQAQAPRIIITPDKSLPTRFDWRDSTAMPTVRNQGGCGSCWAFATLGALECNIKIKDGIEVDLSEQWLVSCNTDGYDCGGGWWVHDYHQWKTDPCGGTGAVFEADKPYTASNGYCNCPFDHPFTINDWSYVDPYTNIPSVNLIKQAILDYGPVSVAIYANSAMQAYGGGIFNGCGSGTVNHGVVLVGWDDDQGPNGVWFLRNSWGTGWGEDGGYMRIPYNCNQVGYGASFVEYIGQTNSPTITTSALPAWTAGQSYIQQLTATGGSGVLTWTDKNANLIGTGLTLQQSGRLSGTPLSAGTISFMARVTDALMQSDEKFLTVTINQVPEVVTTALPEWTEGVAYLQQLEASGGTGGLIWSDEFDDLDGSGLVLSSTGILSGTLAHSGLIEFTAKVADGTGASDESPLDITINPDVVVSPETLPEATMEEPYSHQITCTGGTGEIVWSAVDDGLAGTGLALSPSGQLNGTPVTKGEILFMVEASDEAGAGDTESFTINIIQNYVCGDANGDGDVNLGDAVVLVSYVFSGGAEPDPKEAGDANCDSEVNVADAVYLINYVFSGGPAPCCP